MSLSLLVSTRRVASARLPLSGVKSLTYSFPWTRSYAAVQQSSTDGSNNALKISRDKQKRVTVKPLTSRKTYLVDSYKSLMESNPLVVFVHYNNLLKREDHLFREKIKETGGTMTKLRNRLFQVYLKNSKQEDPCRPLSSKDKYKDHPLLPLFKGPTAAIAYSETTPANIAKLFKLLASAQDKLFILGAKVDNEASLFSTTVEYVQDFAL